MKISIILTNLNTDEVDKTDIESDDRTHFTYIDNDKNMCEIVISNEDFLLQKKAKDYSLELCLKKVSYAKIISSEGELNLDIKIVDFLINDDVLLWRYQIDDEERQIEIVYRG